MITCDSLVAMCADSQCQLPLPPYNSSLIYTTQIWNVVTLIFLHSFLNTHTCILHGVTDFQGFRGKGRGLQHSSAGGPIWAMSCACSGHPIGKYLVAAASFEGSGLLPRSLAPPLFCFPRSSEAEQSGGRQLPWGLFAQLICQLFPPALD